MLYFMPLFRFISVVKFVYKVVEILVGKMVGLHCNRRSQETHQCGRIKKVKKKVQLILLQCSR